MAQIHFKLLYTWKIKTCFLKKYLYLLILYCFVSWFWCSREFLEPLTDLPTTKNPKTVKVNMSSKCEDKLWYRFSREVAGYVKSSMQLIKKVDVIIFWLNKMTQSRKKVSDHYMFLMFSTLSCHTMSLGNKDANDGPPALRGLCGYELLCTKQLNHKQCVGPRRRTGWGGVKAVWSR